MSQYVPQFVFKKNLGELYFPVILPYILQVVVQGQKIHTIII